MWISVDEKMPEPGKKVLLFYKNSRDNPRTILGYHAPAKFFQSCSESEIGEYCEEKDEYYDPEGWYECIDNWGEYSHVFVNEGIPTHWMPLPEQPNAGVTGAEPKA